MVKRIFSLILTVALLVGCTLCMGVCADASNDIELSLSSEQASTNSLITIPITLKNSSKGFWTAFFEIEYDGDYLKYESAVIDGVLTSNTSVNKSLNKTVLSLSISNNEDFSNLTESGVVAKLIFKVKDFEIPEEGKELNLKIIKSDVIDADGNMVLVNLKDGKVTVPYGAVYTGPSITISQTVATTGNFTLPILPSEGNEEGNEYEFPEYKEDEAALVIGQAKANPGSEAIVPVYIVNNPGIWGAQLSFGYDKDIFEYAGCQIGDVFTAGECVASPLASNVCSIVITANTFADNAKNGLLFNIKFKLKENIEAKYYPIVFAPVGKNATYTPESVFNADFDNVLFTYKNGGVTATNEVITTTVESTTISSLPLTSSIFEGEIPGDANGDKEVNGKDVLLLRKYIAQWKVEITFVSADVTADGKVNAKDLLLLRKYIADWKVELLILVK